MERGFIEVIVLIFFFAFLFVMYFSLADMRDVAGGIIRRLRNRVSHKEASMVMGQNFFGVGDAFRYFHHDLIPQKVARSWREALRCIPFKKSTLEACKDTHVLVAVLPLSLTELLTEVLYVPLINKCFNGYNEEWFRKEPFAHVRGRPGWYLIRKESAYELRGKPWDIQRALAPQEYVPCVRVLAYVVIAHFLKGGGRLFQDCYVRTADVGSGNGRVCLGLFERERGFSIRCGFDDNGQYLLLGVALAQPPELP